MYVINNSGTQANVTVMQVNSGASPTLVKLEAGWDTIISTYFTGSVMLSVVYPSASPSINYTTTSVASSQGYKLTPTGAAVDTGSGPVLSTSNECVLKYNASAQSWEEDSSNCDHAGGFGCPVGDVNNKNPNGIDGQTIVAPCTHDRK